MKCVPLTPDRWPDLEDLFGARGACGGCWCMWWRLPRPAWKAGKGESNKQAFFQIVNGNRPPGVLAYRDGKAIGWCAVAPRDEYPVLERSRSLRRIDDQPVWSVTCFFVRKSERGQGVSVALLKAAAEFAKAHGARILEGYPVEPKKGRMVDAFAWTGTVAAFLKAGFTRAHAAHPGPSMPVAATRPSTRPTLRLPLY